jgi:hypothetical protein
MHDRRMEASLILYSRDKLFLIEKCGLKFFQLNPLGLGSFALNLPVVFVPPKKSGFL